MERYNFRPRSIQTTTSDQGTCIWRFHPETGGQRPGSHYFWVGHYGPQDLTTETWIGGYPEGTQAGPVVLFTSGRCCLSEFELSKVMFTWPCWIEPDWDMEIREEGLSYQTSLPKLMPTTWVPTPGVSIVPVTDFPLDSSCFGHQHCWSWTRPHTTNKNRGTFNSSLRV